LKEQGRNIARNQLSSPKGNTGACDGAEILSVKEGRINSSAIFFDTTPLADFMAKG
jgi:hypothetical protein